MGGQGPVAQGSERGMAGRREASGPPQTRRLKARKLVALAALHF
jgi:hypothetical protein